MTMRASMGLAVAVALAFAPGCATVDDDYAAFEHRTNGVAFDANAMARAPEARLPDARLRAAAFADDEVFGKLVGTSETFDGGEVIGRRLVRRSASWLVQKDELHGRVLAVRNFASEGPPTRMSDAQLAAQVRARLTDWGIGAGEIGDVDVRRAMVQDLDEAAPSAPRVHRIKGFVRRSVNGVRVMGHRAVVTFTPDGELQRVLARWPALAAQGHRLRTGLSQGQIVQRARDVLRARGITKGNARIDWAYAPTELSDGQVTLTLKAMVQLPARELADGVDEESRTLEVDIDAVE